MKNLTNSLCLFVCLLTTKQFLFAQGYYGPSLLHECTSGNQFYNYTLVNNPSLNEDSNAIVLVQQVNTGTIIDRHFNYGLWYTGDNWAIFNEEKTDSIPLTAGFHVLKLENGGTYFKFMTSDSFLINHYAIIDHPATNNRPDALLFVTHNWGTKGKYNNHPVGVEYITSGGINKWAILNEDLAPMSDSVVFNIFVTDTNNADAFVHKAKANPALHYTYMSKPQLNNKPGVYPFITHNRTPFGESPGKRDTIGCYVNFKSNLWGIIRNVNTSGIDSGSAYNVLVVDPTISDLSERLTTTDEFTIYPVPAQSILHILFYEEVKEPVNLTVYNLLGTALKKELVENENRASIHLLDLPAGHYLIEANSGRKYIRKPFVIMR